MTEEKAPRTTKRVAWTAISQRVIDYCTAEAKKVSGLSLTQSRILFHLAIYPGKRAASIANSLKLRPTTATSALEIICQRGLANKVTEPNDGKRGTQYFLTEEGYALFPHYIEGFDEAFSEFVEMVGEPALRSTLTAMLPGGAISMVETCIDDKTLKESDVYERLRVSPEDDPHETLFDKAMYVEKIAWSLEEIDMRDTIGMPRKERVVLRALMDLGGDAEVRVLRRLLYMKPATASAALHGLQNRGYVTRISDPDNRRVVIASLTDEGKTIEKKTRPLFNAVFDECFPGFADLPLPVVHHKDED